MSIISDISSMFSDDIPPSYYLLTNYNNASDIDTMIKIYAVISQSYTQQNETNKRPLERGLFAVDSQKIKPYVISIRGVVFPVDSPDVFAFTDFTTYTANIFTKLQNYLNGIQLFTLQEDLSFGIYEPLKLVGFSHEVNSDNTIPEVTMIFEQVQITSDTTTYSNNSEPMNNTRS